MAHAGRSTARRPAEGSRSFGGDPHGNTEAIFGRILLPGEQPATAPIGSQENVFGIEESQVLTRRWED